MLLDWSRGNPYGVLMIAGILVTAAVWGRVTARDGTHDGRLTLIYFFGLIGAFVGAKIAFLLAEGWHFRHDAWALVSGRSITGGLLGGYFAVELGKKWLRYPQTTGDVFAIVTPLGLMLGRVGCLLQGCCPGMACDAAHWWTIKDASGTPRWPAAGVELAFNAMFLAWTMAATRFNWQSGNRFHIYLIAYGVFRFVHEFARDDLRIGGVFTGYHVIAAVIFATGLMRYLQRRRSQAARGDAGPVTAQA